jgi:hypothetical protein
MDIKGWFICDSSDSTNNHIITALCIIFPIQQLSTLFKAIWFSTKEIYGILERVILGLIVELGTKGQLSPVAFPIKFVKGGIQCLPLTNP